MNTTRNDVLGIDVSKKKLDLALLINGKLKAKVFDNTSAGHRALVEWEPVRISVWNGVMK